MLTFTRGRAAFLDNSRAGFLQILPVVSHVNQPVVFQNLRGLIRIDQGSAVPKDSYWEYPKARVSLKMLPQRSNVPLPPGGW